jgi:hypothetical protein
MTFPAIRVDSGIVVALIAKFALVAVAIHTGVLQAHHVLFPVCGNVDPLAIANSLVPPLVEHLHV